MLYKDHALLMEAVSDVLAKNANFEPNMKVDSDPREAFPEGDTKAQMKEIQPEEEHNIDLAIKEVSALLKDKVDFDTVKQVVDILNKHGQHSWKTGYAAGQENPKK